MVAGAEEVLAKDGLLLLGPFGRRVVFLCVE